MVNLNKHLIIMWEYDWKKINKSITKLQKNIKYKLIIKKLNNIII
jgi:hypothetical protein